MRMDAMRELCSVLEQRQDVATSAGMGVLWRQCPRPGFSLQQEQEQSCRRLLHITWRQCLAILLVARLVARSSLGSSGHDSSRQFFELVLEFLQAVATGIVIDGLTTFNREELDPYFEELIGYVAEAVEDYPFVSPDVSVGGEGGGGGCGCSLSEIRSSAQVASISIGKAVPGVASF
jgi:hypothetical protein